MNETATPHEEAAPKPPSDAKLPVNSPSALAVRWQKIKQGLADAAGSVVTASLVEAFLLFENTVDLRVYGRERLKEVRRAGRNPLLVIWHGQGLLPMTAFRGERLCLYASPTREENYPRPLLILRYWTLPSDQNRN